MTKSEGPMLPHNRYLHSTSAINQQNFIANSGVSNLFLIVFELIQTQGNKIMRYSPILLLPLYFCALFVTTAQAKALHLPAIKVVPIQDVTNKRQYELLIKLPENYSDKSDKQYPVIYYTDALWHVEAVSSATAFILEDVISVGISWQKDNEIAAAKDRGEYVSRFRDYSIWQSSKPEHQAKYQFGQADKHLSFIRNQVIKYIEKKYRTDPANRTYFGYSLGGLFGVNALLTQSDTFKHYIIGSPSTKQLSKLKALTDSATHRQPANVLISYGSLEQERSEQIDAFIHYLTNKKDKDLSITKIVPEGDHSSAFPLTIVQGVVWLSKILKQGNE